MNKKIKVTIATFPPLIMEENQRYAGFEIDVWEEIARNINLDFEYEEKQFQEIIPSLADKKSDVGLAGITINEAREKIVDFSHPTLNSGLLILVDKDSNSMHIFKSIGLFFKEGYKAIISPLVLVLAFIVVFSNLLWVAESGAKTFSNNYFVGIFESAWLVICSMSTDSFGDYVPHTWIGRTVVTFIIIGGVAIFGIFIAQLSAFIAVKKIKGDISSYRDLYNKRVATVKDSTSVRALQKIGAKVSVTLNLEDAYAKLKSKEVDAIVFDAPALEYFLDHKKDNNLEIVGDLFEKQSYGIALPSGSKLREKINQAFLMIKESGKYDVIYRKWFGENSLMEL